MAPQMNLLQLNPDKDLHFCKSPSSNQNHPHKILQLKNISSGNVAFKVKTTAPKSYLVRPSSGTVSPGETAEVQIILQPQGSDGGAASSHRFLVQAVATNSSEPVSREAWAEYSKDKVQEQRLNVVMEERDVDLPTNSVQQASATRPQAPQGDQRTSGAENSADLKGDLKVKYDELVQYTLMLEKEKKKLEDDLTMQKRAGSGGAVEGYSKTTLVIVALVVFLLSYCVKFLQ